MSDPTKVIIVVLTTYERTGWPHPSLLDLVEHVRGDNEHAKQYATMITQAKNFIPAASARNIAAKNFAESGADWICMIDNDMSPPTDILDCIKGAPADAGVVVPRFHLWHQDPDGSGHTVLCWGMEEYEKLPDGKPGIALENKFYEISKCGTGLIFIRPEVFRKVPAPWFWYNYDADQSMTATEDINFCTKIKEHGIKMYGNGGFEVGHHHTINIASVARITNGPKPEKVSEAEELGYKIALKAAEQPVE